MDLHSELDTIQAQLPLRGVPGHHQHSVCMHERAPLENSNIRVSWPNIDFWTFIWVHDNQTLTFFQKALFCKMPSSECVWVMTGGVWLVSLDVHQCKNRWEITLSPNIWSLPFLPVPFNARKLFEWAPDSGDVWKLSGGVCMMSGWCLRVSGTVTILNIWGKHNFWSWYSDIGLSYNAL